MDPLDKADARLTHARQGRAFVVTPDTALSPMDESSTVQIRHAVVSEPDAHEAPDTTVPLETEQDADTPPFGLPQLSVPTADSGQRQGDDSTAARAQNDELIPTTRRTARSDVARRLDGA